MVIGIFEDSKGLLWFSTEGSGITSFNKLTKTYTNYSTADGLPSNFVFNILEDDEGNLWMSTTKGLVCFEKALKKFRTYTTFNGILSSQFNYNSAFKDESSGTFYFGCLGGMISFKPSDFKIKKRKLPIYITNVLVSSEENKLNGFSKTTRSILVEKEIHLSYNQSSIAIDFAALSYVSPEMTKYAYRMEGIDKSWIYLPSNRRVYFTDLPSGSHTFSVKAMNDYGEQISNETKLVIRISPPWWETIWAYIGYFFLTSFAILYLFRTYHNKVKF